MSDYRDVAYAAVAFGFGTWSFVKGFTSLGRKRLIENTPVSRVRGLALGLVELNGKAEKMKPLQSPFTQVECVFYRYTIEQYRSSGRSGRWVVIAKGDSSYCPFWLNDGTGRIMVFPQGAELMMPVDYEFETGLGKTLPDNLVRFMQGNGLNYQGMFGNYPLRFKEWFVTANEPVCVLGTARKAGDPVNDHKKRLIQRLDTIKHDPQKMQEADLDHDGSVSSEEWDAVVKKVEQALLEEELQASPQDHSTDVTIGLVAGQAFIISDESQSQMIKSLSWQAFLGVFGGAALSLAMLAYLLIRLGPWTKL